MILQFASSVDSVSLKLLIALQLIQIYVESFQDFKPISRIFENFRLYSGADCEPADIWNAASLQGEANEMLCNMEVEGVN